MRSKYLQITKTFFLFQAGYLEGIEAGKQQGLEEGFHHGFVRGIQHTVHWAVLRGKIRCVPSTVPKNLHQLFCLLYIVVCRHTALSWQRSKILQAQMAKSALSLPNC